MPKFGGGKPRSGMYRTSATGLAAISLAIAPSYRFRLRAISLHLSAAPTTSENLTVTLNSALGSAYNCVLYKRDLTVGSLTDLYVEFGDNFTFEYNESVTVAWTNTDTKTYGIVAYCEKV
jgi:hypothetical protein